MNPRKKKPLDRSRQVRSTSEVFQDHLQKRKASALEEDIQDNYDENIVLLTCIGIYRGHDGVRESAKVLTESLPNSDFEYYNELVDGEFAFLEWRAFSDHKEVKEGADSFVIRGGKIVAQSIHYKVHPRTD